MTAFGISPRVVAYVAAGLIVIGVILAALDIITVVRAVVTSLVLAVVAFVNWRRSAASG